MSLRPSVAVIGAGIFGVTSAVILAQRGLDVYLFESGTDLLGGTTGRNQARFHLGYHYPRSPETLRELGVANKSFKDLFGQTIIDEHDHFYAVSESGSLTSAQAFLEFCRLHNLPYEISEPSILRSESVATCISVPEGFVDIAILRKVCWAYLREARIRVGLRKSPTAQSLSCFDFIIAANYSHLNTVLTELQIPNLTFEFEICEIPTVRLSASYKNHSVVVMDGEFPSIDPLGRTATFLLYDAKYSVLSRNVGTRPRLNASLRRLIKQGFEMNPSVSNYQRMISSAQRFLRGLEDAEYTGSMFAMRVLLPGLEQTDARPTLVKEVGDRVIAVLGGKIVTCVAAGYAVADIVEGKGVNSDLVRVEPWRKVGARDSRRRTWPS